jgi:uracil-DNA glycosylase
MMGDGDQLQLGGLLKTSALSTGAWGPGGDGAFEAVLDTKWSEILGSFWRSQEGASLSDFLASRILSGARVYPPTPYLALSLTPSTQVRVVILGQDPYHGEGQAHGLAFSVPEGVKPPPSLRNIFKELAREGLCARACAALSTGNLESWAKRGVLLLNTTLTVEHACAGSHSGRGWEALTDKLIEAIAAQEQPIVFMLWGAHAHAKLAVIRRALKTKREEAQAAMKLEQSLDLNLTAPLCLGPHLILRSNHPSPLSALRGPAPFIGCNHFSIARTWLASRGVECSWEI